MRKSQVCVKLAYMEKDCIFCGIIEGKIPSEKVYEDDNVLSFLDINPNNHGHTLVVPKDHFENLYVIPGEPLCRMALVVQKLAIAVREATQADGVNIMMNNESAAGQVVNHAHIHIIPRHESDVWPHFPHQTYSGDEMKTVGEKIREAVEK